jgi:hypothetical protein
VAASSPQITDLATKLWNRTQAGGLAWEQFGDGSFQTRYGDFVISINSFLTPGTLGGISSMVMPNVSLTVKKLDGKLVFGSNSSQSINSLAAALGSKGTPTIPVEAQQTLQRLYTHLNNRDTELDELLKIL